MKIETFTQRRTPGANTYILTSADECVVIDPSVPYHEIKNSLTARVKYIIVTHAHFDHIYAIDSWVDNTSAEVLVGELDAPALADATLNCYLAFMGIDKGYYGPYNTVKNGDIITFGEEKLKIIETPGHSRGSISILAPSAVFVGDVVFSGGGYGRVDLPFSDFTALYASIKKLKKLDGSTTVYSGHGAPFNVFEIQQYFI